MTEDDKLAILLLFEKNVKVCASVGDAHTPPMRGTHASVVCVEVQGAESRWAPHIRYLPQKVNTVHCWSEEEIEALKGTNVHSLAERLLTQARGRACTHAGGDAHPRTACDARDCAVVSLLCRCRPTTAAFSRCCS